MHIEYISIKGYRSFNDVDGIELKDLKRFNLFIGPNNAGKSNLMRFFLMVQTMMQSKKGRTFGALLALEEGPSLEDSFRHLALGIDDFWNDATQIIDASILLKVDANASLASSPILPIIGSTGNRVLFRIQSTHNPFRPGVDLTKKDLLAMAPYLRTSVRPTEHIECDSRYSELNKRILENLSQFSTSTAQHALGKWSIQTIDGDCYVALIEVNRSKEISIEGLRVDGTNVVEIGSDGYVRDEIRDAIVDLCWLFTSSIFPIASIRDTQIKVGKDYLGEDGSTAISKLCSTSKERKNGAEWIRIRGKLQDWIARLIPASNGLTIEFSEDLIRFNMQIGNRPRIQYLRDLGSGVSQLLVLLITLYFEKDSPRIVFIDEPENCLHAGAVLEFINILNTEVEFKKHQFFIATHSAALIDSLEDDFAIFRVAMDKEKGTQMTRCSDLMEFHGLLNDLGQRASQILQTNFVIWVEGPSDSRYIQDWIKLLADGDFVKDKHYSFLHYGGSLIKHLGNGDEEGNNAVNIFATSRNGCIVMDSDQGREDAEERAGVRLVGERFGKTEDSRITVWVTAGREIENYIPTELWQVAAKGEEFWKKKLVVNAVQQAVHGELTDDFELGQWEDFAEKLAGCYGFEDDSVEWRKLKNYHDSQKVLLGKSLSGHWKKEHLERYGLRKQMEDLVAAIREANGMAKTRESRSS